MRRRSAGGVLRAACIAAAVLTCPRAAAVDLAPGFLLLDSGIPGPRLAVVAGLHGDEPSGAAAARALARGGAPARGTILVLPAANPAALAAGARFAPGGADMNRLFGPGARREPEAERAAAILATLLGADLVLDLHEEGPAWAEADLPTLVISTAAAALALDLLGELCDFGTPFAYTGGAPAGSLVGELGRLGARAIVVETPSWLPEAERVSLHLAVVEAALGLLGMR